MPGLKGRAEGVTALFPHDVIPTTRRSRSLAAALLIVGGTAGLWLAAELAVPAWSPVAPAYRRKGPADAKVLIADFSDFQCQDCAAAAPLIKALVERHPGEVAVVFKHKYWDYHPHSLTAALAAECAGKAGKFWEVHDALFANQRSWSALGPDAARGLMLAYAEGAGLDPDSVEYCMAYPAVAAAVAADLAETESLWVRATPSFFINGRRFAGSRQLRTLGLKYVEDQLK